MQVQIIKATESLFSNHTCPFSQKSIGHTILENRKSLGLPAIFAAIPNGSTACLAVNTPSYWTLYSVTHLNTHLKTTSLANKVYYLLSHATCPNNFRVVGELNPNDGVDQKKLLLDQTNQIFLAFHSPTLHERLRNQQELFESGFGEVGFWKHLLEREALSFFLDEYLSGTADLHQIAQQIAQFGRLLCKREPDTTDTITFFDLDTPSLKQAIDDRLAKNPKEHFSLASSVVLALYNYTKYREWAFSHLRRAIGSTPSDYLPNFLLSALVFQRTTCLSDQVLQEGEHALRMAYTLNPQMPGVLLLHSRVHADGLLGFQKDVSLAKEFASNALRLHPHSIAAHQLVAELDVILEKQLSSFAYECFQKALFLYPSNGAIYFSLGKALLYSGEIRINEAILYLEKAFSLGYKTTTLLITLGAIYCKGIYGYTKQLERGIQLLQEELKKGVPHNVHLKSSIYSTLGIAYVETTEEVEKSREQACRCFEKVLQFNVNPTDIFQAHIHLASLLSTKVQGISQNYSKALEHAKAANELSPGNLYSAFFMGKIYFHGDQVVLKDYEKAQYYFEAAIEKIKQTQHPQSMRVILETAERYVKAILASKAQNVA